MSPRTDDACRLWCRGSEWRGEQTGIAMRNDFRSNENRFRFFKKSSVQNVVRFGLTSQERALAVLVQKMNTCLKKNAKKRKKKCI